MKCDAREFGQAATLVGRLIAQVPGVVVEVAGTPGHVTLAAASDVRGTRIGVRSRLSAEGGDGEWTKEVDGAAFAGMTKALAAGGYETVAVDGSGQALVVSVQGVERTLSLEPSALQKKAAPRLDFDRPDLPHPCLGEAGVPLAQAMKQTAAFALRDESCPILNAVFVRATTINLGEQKHLIVELVSTDTYRLYRRRIAMPVGVEVPEGMHGVVPAPFCEQLTKDAEGLVFALDADRIEAVAATVGNATWHGRALERAYVNYEKVIPSGHKWSAQLEVPALVELLQAAAPIADDDNHRIGLSVVDGKLRVEADAVDRGNFSGTVALLELESEPPEFALNVRYVLAFLHTIDPQQPVTIQGAGALNALAWTGTSREPEHDAEPPLYVQMPMQVR